MVQLSAAMGRHTWEEAQRTRKRVLEAAAALVASRGVERVSVREVAEAAGVTRGAVYWHFEDRSDLLRAVFAQFASPWESDGPSVGGHPPDDPWQQITRLALLPLARLAACPAALRSLAAGHATCAALDGAAPDLERTAHRERLIEACEQLAGEGACAWDVPARTMALALSALVDGLMRAWVSSPAAFDLQSVGQGAVAVYLAGLATGRAQRPDAGAVG